MKRIRGDEGKRLKRLNWLKGEEVKRTETDERWKDGVVERCLNRRIGAG
ncbi:MAG: hypothetical protein AB9882_03625 [Ignavibacteriaceae bacterium]